MADEQEIDMSVNHGPDLPTDVAPAEPMNETVVAIATEAEESAAPEEIREGVVRTGPALLRVSTKDSGEQLVRKGYQFRDQSLSVTVLGKTVTGATATHKDFKVLLRHKPNWFRSNVILGYYSPDDNYWK